jgi:hypothetical protein
MSKTEMVSKVTLSSGKIVLLKQMKIEFQELAAKAASPRAGGDAMVLSVMMQKELLKLLIAQVDGKTLKGVEKERLDDVFSYQEYMQLMKVVQQLMGGDDEGNVQMEVVSYGNT